jgi:hypothetical protein
MILKRIHWRSDANGNNAHQDEIGQLQPKSEAVIDAAGFLRDVY